MFAEKHHSPLTVVADTEQVLFIFILEILLGTSYIFWITE